MRGSAAGRRSLTSSPQPPAPSHAQRLLAATLIYVGIAGSAHAIPSNEPVEAMWQSQQISFKYQAERTLHTCPGLVRQVATVLRAVGAGRLHLQCSYAPGKLLLHITLSTPILATPEALVAASTFTATDRLIARARGEQLPSANDLERFPAVWRPIQLTGARGLGLRAGDCELMNGLKDQLFPKLAVRITRFRCSNDSVLVQPHFSVEALVAL